MYEEGLLKRLREGEHLEPGCAEEAEIRGSSIWAVEVTFIGIKTIIKVSLVHEVLSIGSTQILCMYNIITLTKVQ